MSRRADQPEGPVFLWPTKSGACFSAEGVSSCASDADIADREVLIGLYRGGALDPALTRLTGLVRDGISRVAITVDNGKQLDVPVNENAFLADFRGTPTKLEWVGPTGAREEGLPDLSPGNPPAK